MKKSSVLLMLFLISIALQGCETFRGAKEGFQKDWEDWNKKDGWVQENLW